MKVLHIIPAAFNYYDDIKAAAFGLAETELSMGIAVEAYTMQYQAPSRGDQTETEVVVLPGSSRKYDGTVSLNSIGKEINTFDVVHVHVPILGGLKTVLNWKRANPKLLLLVTVYRESKTPDFFSLILLIYNRIMLAKLFKQADFIGCESLSVIKAFYDRMAAPVAERVLEIDTSTNLFGKDISQETPQVVEMNGAERLAFKYIILYNSKT